MSPHGVMARQPGGPMLSVSATAAGFRSRCREPHRLERLAKAAQVAETSVRPRRTGRSHLSGGRRRPCPNKGTRPPPAPRRPGSPTRQTRSRAPDPSAGVENSCCRTWACYGPAAAGAPGCRRGGFQARLFSDSECPPPRMGEDFRKPRVRPAAGSPQCGPAARVPTDDATIRLRSDDREPPSDSTLPNTAARPRHRPNRRPTEC